jgi:O-acetylhomoserine (thiol)-lyase
MADRTFGFDTLSLHAGQIPDAATGSRAVPIYQTSAYVFDSPEHAASLFNLQTFGNVYSRLSNPTVAVFEERIASLEGGRAAVATGSGMSAQMIALLNVCEAGDQIVAARTLYGGTHTQLSVNFKKLGIETVFVDSADPENFARAITPQHQGFVCRNLGQPFFECAGH